MRRANAVRAPTTILGLAAAKARGQAALDVWIADGIVVPGPVFAARRGVAVGQLGAAVRRGDLY